MRATTVTTLVIALVLPGLAAAAELDRSVAIESGSTLKARLVDASLAVEPQGKVLSITIEPKQALDRSEAQAAAEHLFADTIMPSAERLGASRVSIFVKPGTPKPKERELRSHTSVFKSNGNGVWSLVDRWARIALPARKTLHLEDGMRITLERSEVRSEGIDGVVRPTLHVEILLNGLNPMLESDVIYSAMKSSWAEIFRPQAEDQYLTGAELIAHVRPATRRFQMRDATVLQVVAGKEGKFPPLPVFPEADLKPPSLTQPAGRYGEAEARFGHLDVSRFDRLIDASIAARPTGKDEAAPLALLSP